MHVHSMMSPLNTGMCEALYHLSNNYTGYKRIFKNKRIYKNSKYINDRKLTVPQPKFEDARKKTVCGIETSQSEGLEVGTVRAHRGAGITQYVT